MPHQNLDALGICSHCKGLISLSEYALSEGSEIWHCSHCRAIVDHESFGFQKPDSEERSRWVGPERVWVDTRPENHFNLGELTVYVHPPRFRC